MKYQSPNARLGYQHLQQAQTPHLSTKKTNQQRFWKKYVTSPITSQHQTSIVSSISTNANQKQLMLFSHGRVITMVDTKKNQIVKQLANFNTNITAVTLRKDGAIMAYGDENGRVDINDTKQKFKLRSFKNHKKRINCLDFSGTGTDQTLYSVSDDMTIRQYDIAAGNVINSLENAHIDYIKCVKSIPNTQSILTGAYDKYVKLFDFRTNQQPSMQFNHHGQVQWLDLFPSAINFVVCGEKKITSWDIRKNDKPVFEHIAGKKTISCVRVALDGSRIISSSFDQHIKVFKSDTFQLTFQQKLESPILTFDISRNNLCLGLGLENKNILLKSRTQKSSTLQDQSQDQKQVEDQIAQWFKNNLQKNRNKSILNDKYFYRGIYDKPNSYEVMFERNQNKKVSEFDKMLKKFQYKKAFLISLKKKNMAIFLALVDQYIQRGCLERTIRGLTQSQIEQVVPILSQMLTDIRYSNTIILLLEKITEFHDDKHENQSFRKLKQSTSQQLDCINYLKEIDGMLELIENSCL